MLEDQNNELISHIRIVERDRKEMESELEGLREVATRRMEENDRLNEELRGVREEMDASTKKLVKEI